MKDPLPTDDARKALHARLSGVEWSVFAGWTVAVFMPILGAMTWWEIFRYETAGKGFTTFKFIIRAYEAGGVPGLVLLFGALQVGAIWFVRSARREREALREEVGAETYWALSLETQAHLPRWMRFYRDDRSVNPVFWGILWGLFFMVGGVFVLVLLFPDARL